MAHILGLIAILLASTISAANLPNYFNLIVFSFIIFHVLIHIILQSFTYHLHRKRKLMTRIFVANEFVANESLETLSFTL